MGTLVSSRPRIFGIPSKRNVISMFYRFTDKAGNKYVTTPFANHIWDEAAIATMNHQDPQPTYRGQKAIDFLKGLQGVSNLTKIDVTKSSQKDQELFNQLIKPWMNFFVAVNVSRKHVLAGFQDIPIKLTSLYIVVDNGISAIQSYDYFWDDDPKFQRVFRDDMGGNHQWLFFWVNSGGRSGYASISTYKLPPTLAILIPRWYQGSNQDTELMSLLRDYPKVSIPEFNKQEQFIMKRINELIAQGVSEEEAFEKALREYGSKIKARDPEVYYPEYAQMGFPHPRPDYRDERYK